MTPSLHLSRTLRLFLSLFLDVVLALTNTVFSIMFRTHVRAFHVPHVLHYAASFLIISHTCTPVIVINYHRRHRLPQLCVVCCFPPLTPTQHTNINAYNWNFFLSFFFLFFFNRPFNYAFVSPFLSLRNDYPLSPRRPASYVLYPFENVFPNPDPFLPVFSGDLLWYLSCGDAIVRAVNRVSEPFFN